VRVGAAPVDLGPRTRARLVLSWQPSELPASSPTASPPCSQAGPSEREDAELDDRAADPQLLSTGSPVPISGPGL
jgi:hypothetical protein